MEVSAGESGVDSCCWAARPHHLHAWSSYGTKDNGWNCGFEVPVRTKLHLLQAKHKTRFLIDITNLETRNTSTVMAN